MLCIMLYFSDQKLAAKRQHREAVSMTSGSDVSKAKKQKQNKPDLPTVSRVELEEVSNLTVYGSKE